MGLPRIPDEIYENRCKYCWHFVKNKENREIKEYEIFLHGDRKPCPCKIQLIAQYRYQICDNGEYKYIPYEDGECRSFSPNYGYPMCYSCEHFDRFSKEHSRKKDVPLSKRKRVALGNTYGNESRERGFLICSNWECAKHSRDYALKNAAEGRIPRMFDSKTFKLLSPIEESRAAEEWLEIEKKHIAEINKKAKKEELDKRTDKNGQLSLF